MKLGSQGDAVHELQMALKALGYPLKGSGYFGQQTDAAVEAFQRKHGLVVDGEVGPATQSKLDEVLNGQEPMTKPLDNRRQLWLTVSLSHVGLREAPGSRNNPDLVDMIHSVADDYQSDATPWCAGWVSYCLARAGIKPSKSPLWALSYAEEWGVKLSGPALGAIAVKTRNGGGHVTFVAGRTAGNALACCGGNQNDMVNVSPYNMSAFNKGFYWPKGIALPERIGFNTLPLVNTSGKIISES